MKEYIYPAIFHKNIDESVTVIFPDLPGCITEGKSFGNAMKMAQAALSQWIEFLKAENEEIPAPSTHGSIKVVDDEIVSYIQADIRDNRAVKRTVSIPKWMDEKVAEIGLSLSKVLQEAVRQKIKSIK